MRSSGVLLMLLHGSGGGGILGTITRNQAKVLKRQFSNYSSLQRWQLNQRIVGNALRRPIMSVPVLPGKAPNNGSVLLKMYNNIHSRATTSATNVKREEGGDNGSSGSSKNPKPGQEEEGGSGKVDDEVMVKKGDEVVLSKKAKLKRAIKDYGSTVLVFHITMSLCSLGLFYLLVSSGLDLVSLMSKLGIGEESIFQNKVAQGASTFVVAYAIHKVFAPVRIAITLTATPFIVKKLRSVGVLRTPSSQLPKP